MVRKSSTKDFLRIEQNTQTLLMLSRWLTIIAATLGTDYMPGIVTNVPGH